MQNALQIRNMTKAFGGALALDSVSLDIKKGETHGLLGSNGSGKSTLIKILSGFHEPSKGTEAYLFGNKLRFPLTGAVTRSLGLAFVHQPDLTVTENFRIGDLSTENNWAINWKNEHREIKSVFEKYNLDINPTVQVSTLSAVEQALISIVRAYEELKLGEGLAAKKNGVLILDEPTPFLPRSGVDQLFDLIRRCVSFGASVIFVSHDIDEVIEITDRATILRDGKLIETVETKNTSYNRFVELIIGRSLEGKATKKTNIHYDSQRLITVRSLEAKQLGPISFDISPGEILGLTGLVGSGFDQIVSALYGARDGTKGKLSIGSRSINLVNFSPIKALERGIAYLPADRLAEAGVGSISVGDNIVMPNYDNLTSGYILTDPIVYKYSERLAEDLDVKPNIPSLTLSSLSGGNAQKSLLAKWLQLRPTLLLLDEPTQGVDVGARETIWDELNKLTIEGSSIIVASTDYDQLAQICDRILVFNSGIIVEEMTGGAFSKSEIAECVYTVASQSQKGE